MTLYIMKFVYTMHLQLEQKFNEVQQFYSTSNAKHLDTRVGSLVKEREKDKFSASSFKKKQQDIASREAVAAQRMQELMRQFGTILRQVALLFILVWYPFIAEQFPFMLAFRLT